MAPRLRVTALHIENMQAIQRLDWPADGPGWGGTVPDVLLVGGANGSGKTTLLEFIAEAWLSIGDRKHGGIRPHQPLVYRHFDKGLARAWIDFEITSRETGVLPVRFLLGDQRFVEDNARGVSFGRLTGERLVASGRRADDLTSTDMFLARDALCDALEYSHFEQSDLPGFLYVPSGARSLTIPSVAMKRGGKRREHAQFFHRWEPPQEWETSLEALLYSARWEDLNAKEEGRPEDATHFDRFARAYDAFFGPEKRLTWHKGELFVEIVATGTLHDISGLSSGEQQILVLVSELHDHWRPGSLILIDEPELHLHVAWQLAFWDTLTRGRDERGGQLIATTQSSELFGHSNPGTNVILGSRAL